MAGTLLIRNLDFILTADPQGRVLRRASILVEDGKVVAVGDVAQRDADEVIEGHGLTAFPGIINAHTHIVMTAMKGLAADRSDVLYKIFWPVERALTPELAEKLALLGAVEAVKSGSTLIADHYFFMDRIARAVEAVGLRGYLGHTVMTWGGPWVGEEELRKSEDFVKRWSGRSPLITPVLAPHSPETVSPEWLEHFREVSRETGLYVHMHLAQTQREIKEVKRRTGLTPVRLLSKLGLLGPKTLAAHCLYVDDEELKMLASTSTLVVQCPSTYMLAGERFHAYRLLKMGGSVLVGTDAPCYCDGIDAIREIRNLVYGQRLVEQSPSVLSAREALELATRKAAESLGQERLGYIGPGALADIVLIDSSSPRFRPALDPVANLVYSSSSSDIKYVLINGEVVVREGRATRVDERRAVEEGERAAAELLRRAMDIEPELEKELGLSL